MAYTLEQIARINEKQADLMADRMASGYTPKEFGIPVERAFRRTAKMIHEAITEQSSDSDTPIIGQKCSDCGELVTANCWCVKSSEKGEQDGMDKKEKDAWARYDEITTSDEDRLREEIELLREIVKWFYHETPYPSDWSDTLEKLGCFEPSEKEEHISND